MLPVDPEMRFQSFHAKALLKNYPSSNDLDATDYLPPRNKFFQIINYIDLKKRSKSHGTVMAVCIILDFETELRYKIKVNSNVI
jgi:hypothetical protein